MNLMEFQRRWSVIFYMFYVRFICQKNLIVARIALALWVSKALLNYDRSISPFNIQDEFALPNFSRSQVQKLLAQYTDEVGQAFAPEVINNLHKQTAGQPFLVNRLAQILTDVLKINGVRFLLKI
jgi:hypothetical protein